MDVLTSFFGKEILADDDYLYWTEAHVKEYDDEPVYIARAAVKRRRHESGEVEVLFDFKRDDMFCTPHRLGFVRGNLSWFCAEEFLDGNGRSDSSRFVTLIGGALHEVPVPPRTRPRFVAPNGWDVYVAPGFEAEAVSLLDPNTGDLDSLAEIPPELAPRRLYSASLRRGDSRLFGIHERERVTTVWSLAPGGETSLRPIGSLQGGWLRGEIAAGQELIVGYGAYPDHALWAFGRGEPTLLLQGRPATPLFAERGHVYFESENVIRRLDRGSGHVSDMTPAKGVVRAAVGGGWLYWQTFKHELHRTRIRR